MSPGDPHMSRLILGTPNITGGMAYKPVSAAMPWLIFAVRLPYSAATVPAYTFVFAFASCFPCFLSYGV